MRLRKDCHSVMVDDELIIFDEKNDAFYFLSKDDTKYVMCKDVNSLLPLPESVHDLIRMGVIQSGEEGICAASYASKNFGFDEYEWSYARECISKSKLKISLMAFSILTLLLVKALLFTFGFGFILKLVKKSKKHSRCRIDDSSKCSRANLISNHVKISSKFLPFRFQCLEHALVTFFICWVLKVDVNIKIGIQTYNFLSHAWIECEDEVVGDNQELRNKLIVIFNLQDEVLHV